jgi:sugar phosphate isomerase/epimerase
MPIYVSTACLPGKAPIARRLQEYAEVGFLHVELGAGISLPAVGWQYSDIKLGQSYIIHNYFPAPSNPFVLNLASDDHGIRRRSIELARGALDLTAQVGARFYSVHGGFITDPTGFERDGFVFPMPSSPEESKFAVDRFVGSIETVLSYAEKLGIQLLVENNVCTRENQGKLLLQTAEEFEELFRRCPSTSLGMLLDTGHLNVSAATFGFDRMEFVERVAPFVRAFHLHDNDGMTDRHDAIQCGSWVITVANQSAFTHCPVILESKFQNLHAMRQHVRWLQRELHRN